MNDLTEREKSFLRSLNDVHHNRFAGDANQQEQMRREQLKRLMKDRRNPEWNIFLQLTLRQLADRGYLSVDQDILAKFVVTSKSPPYAEATRKDLYELLFSATFTEQGNELMDQLQQS